MQSEYGYTIENLQTVISNAEESIDALEAMSEETHLMEELNLDMTEVRTNRLLISHLIKSCGDVIEDAKRRLKNLHEAEATKRKALEKVIDQRVEDISERLRKDLLDAYICAPDSRIEVRLNVVSHTE
jgi:hypothetical protein